MRETNIIWWPDFIPQSLQDVFSQPALLFQQSSKHHRWSLKKGEAMKRLVAAISVSLAMMLCLSAPAAAVVVSDVWGLEAAIYEADQGGDKKILLTDGTYTLSGMLWVEASGVTVRSESGAREAVIIEGEGMTGGVSHIFNVAGTDFTARDMTLRMAANHAIQFQPGGDNPKMQNLIIQDTGEQMIKGSWDSANPDTAVDNGLVEDCIFEFTAGIGPQYYIGGIDVHRGQNWIVRRNIFKNIISPSEDVAEFAVHFWNWAVNTLVERNLIVNCDRGIGFGLGERGHTGGVIRNNMIYHNAEEGFADVAIAAENSPNTQIYNNTVFMENSYPNAIEYRWEAAAGLLIANNLVNRAITARDGASGVVTHNRTDARAGWFVDASGGNLHLAYAVGEVVNQAMFIEGLTDDFDGQERPGDGGFDIGADQYTPPAETAQHGN